MSYNGSGTFSINTAGQPVITGTVISSTAFNALTADLATGLSTAITKDGQTTTTSRILFAQGISSTLTTDATSATTGSIITAGGISMQKALWVGTTSRLVGNVQADGLLGIGMTPARTLDVTGTFGVTGASTLGGALTYGGVTLSNSVTGTGSMVLSASPTFTGTLSADNIGAAAVRSTGGTGTASAGVGVTLLALSNSVKVSVTNLSTGGCGYCEVCIDNGQGVYRILTQSSAGTNQPTFSISSTNLVVTWGTDTTYNWGAVFMNLGT
jgi:fibronectin-binding autotransporter adhesin